MFLVSLGGACADEAEDPPFPTTLADCGQSLAVLRERDGVTPALGASYSEALAEWPFPEAWCGLGVFSGECADGKRFLYRNGGFTSEIRYFQGEDLVGYVGSGDVALCPSVCPSSRFYGSIEGVRCDSPSLTELCPGSSEILGGDGLWLPFANGEPPGGCPEL